ncbi:MAG: MFS transporter [Methanoregulaceae archaeon]|nr:MFS transporter [Methanoregulaceae archaeon]
MYSAASKRLVQVIAALGSAIAPFMVASLIVATPVIGEEFSADIAMLGWITASFFLVAGAFLVPFGRIADIRGSKKVFTAGMGFYLVAALVCMFAPGMEVLIAGRVLTGIGAAMVFGTSIALLSLVFPEEERGAAIGINIAAMFTGFGAGLLAGGAITYYVSWRGIFAIVAIIAAANLVLILSRVRGECELARTSEYDPYGMFLFISGVLLFMYGLSEISTLQGLVILVAGSGALAGFCLWERRCSHPLIPPAFFSSGSLALALGTNIIFQASGFGIALILSLYLQYVYGMDSLTAGIVLLISQLLLIVLGPYSGRLSDRYPPHRVAAAGCLANGIGMLLLVSIGQTTPLPLIVLSLALNGLGFALFMPSVVKWALLGVPKEHYGILSGGTETARLVGIGLSNGVIIITFSFIMGDTPVSPENVPLFLSAARWAIVLYSGMAFAAMVFALRASSYRDAGMAPHTP